MGKFIEKVIHCIRSEKGTIVRTILQVCAIVNQIIAVIGMTTFATAPWYQWVSVIVTFVITTVNWWENNDFTSFAKLGTKVVDALEDGKITSDEVLDILKDPNKRGK